MLVRQISYFTLRLLAGFYLVLIVTLANDGSVQLSRQYIRSQ